MSGNGWGMAAMIAEPWPLSGPPRAALISAAQLPSGFQHAERVATTVPVVVSIAEMVLLT